MSSLLSQVSYPVFLYCVFLFFIFASAFSFVVGVGLALRNDAVLRFFNFMNTWVSTRKLIKPLTRPRLVEPVLFKYRNLFGSVIILGAALSIFLLMGVDSDLFVPVYSGVFSHFTAKVLAGYTESFLLVGNIFCLALGVLVLFFPRLLSRIEAHTDKWYSLRKQTRPLSTMHHQVDQWVLAHPTVSGVTLSILSLGLGFLMYFRL